MEKIQLFSSGMVLGCFSKTIMGSSSKYGRILIYGKCGSFQKDDKMEEEECSAAEEECSSVEDDEFVDTAKLVRNQDSAVHRYSFHIVYSLSYRVPVLYFRAYCSDGQPLALEDIEKDIPVNSVQLLTKSKWTFLTQEEHSILNRPWYTLHPCGTMEWMKLLLGNKTRIDQGGIPVDKYLVSWFSVVGQVFGLKIPFEMVQVFD